LRSPFFSSAFAAYEDRYRPLVARRLARRLFSDDARGFGSDCGFSQRPHSVKLRLQLGFGGSQSLRELREFAAVFALASSACSFASVDAAEAAALSVAANCATL
jgi:hypothetical protein